MHVGQKVHVKRLEENSTVFGFIFPMQKYCNRIVTISRVFENRRYFIIEEDNQKWTWTVDMITDIEPWYKNL